jgi:hypothetical protein
MPVRRSYRMVTGMNDEFPARTRCPQHRIEQTVAVHVQNPVAGAEPPMLDLPEASSLRPPDASCLSEVGRLIG